MLNFRGGTSPPSPPPGTAQANIIISSSGKFSSFFSLFFSEVKHTECGNLTFLLFFMIRFAPWCQKETFSLGTLNNCYFENFETFIGKNRKNTEFFSHFYNDILVPFIDRGWTGVYLEPSRAYELFCEDCWWLLLVNKKDNSSIDVWLVS